MAWALWSGGTLVRQRGHVLFRVGWYDEAARTYQDAEQKFQNIAEPRGTALARLGWLKSAHRLGRSRSESIEDLTWVRDSLESNELRHTRQLVEDALAELTEESATRASCA